MWPTNVKKLAAVLGPILRIIGPIVIEGEANLPEEGGILIVAPHRSLWDGVIIQLAVTNRQIIYMAKEPMFRWPLVGHFLRYVEAFPVTQDSADRTALNTAIRKLRDGLVIAVFPEGKIRPESKSIGELQSGVAFISSQSEAPIIAISIRGSARPWHLFRKITLRFSGQFKPPTNKIERNELLKNISAFLNE